MSMSERKKMAECFYCSMPTKTYEMDHFPVSAVARRKGHSLEAA